MGAKGTTMGWVPRKPKTTPLKAENELRTHIHPDCLVESSSDDRLTLLNVSWQIAHSQRRRARNLQRKLNDNHKELDRHQKKSANA